MNKEQLADRISNIDETLVQQFAHVPDFGRRRKRAGMKRLSALAAVLMLMVCSFTAGALTFAREVPAEQEQISFEEIGLTLLLPADWKGEYAAEREENGSYIVYNPEMRRACMEFYGDGGFDWGGNLFYIIKWDEPMTAEQVRAGGEWDYARNEYIMTTKDGTYLLYYASDVQFTPETEQKYRKMESEICNIRFVVENALADK